MSASTRKGRASKRGQIGRGKMLGSTGHATQRHRRLADSTPEVLEYDSVGRPVGRAARRALTVLPQTATQLTAATGLSERAQATLYELLGGDVLFFGQFNDCPVMIELKVAGVELRRVGQAYFGEMLVERIGLCPDLIAMLKL